MKLANKRYGVIPIIAFVRGRDLINFFTELKEKYVFGIEYSKLREALKESLL